MNEKPTVDPAQSKPLGPLGIAFRYVLARVEAYSAAGLLDEETLTSSILGGLGAALPLVAKVYGSGSSEPIEQVSWGAYKKSGRSTEPGSEAASGADFAMVLWESPTHARIAVFQAKKGVTVPPDVEGNTKWQLDVHRKPPKRTGRPAQLPMLIATGISVGLPPDANGERLTTEAIVSLFRKYSEKEKQKVIADLHWIHYLVYWNDAPLYFCVRDVSPAIVIRELDPNNTARSLVAMPPVSALFFDLIRAGLEEVVMPGWLRLDKLSLEELLPDLLDLMPVYVGDDKRGEPRLDPAHADYLGVIARADPSTTQKIELMENLIRSEGPGSTSGMSP